MSRDIRSYKDLIVWQKSVDLAVDLYGVTRKFPAAERFGMTSQIQRSGVSIPSNTAEGHSKSGPGHYLSHLSHSRGSLSELETLLIVGNRVGYVKSETYRDLCERTDEIGRMLHSLTRSVAASSAAGLPHAPRD
jgi:four helix bundle protein